jgi:RNA binding exosome subunit
MSSFFGAQKTHKIHKRVLIEAKQQDRLKRIHYAEDALSQLADDIQQRIQKLHAIHAFLDAKKTSYAILIKQYALSPSVELQRQRDKIKHTIDAIEAKLHHCHTEQCITDLSQQYDTLKVAFAHKISIPH